MALSTATAPVYGGGTLVIEFTSDTELSSDDSYYVIYEGSQQRHVTTARRLSPCKLHSIIPGHNEAESVQVSILCYHGDDKRLLTNSQFSYHNDGAFFLAQFLVDSVYNLSALEDLELVKSDHFDIADEDLSTLDQRLSRALAYLDFPEWWSLLGPHSEEETPVSRESLLHFTARLGLNRVAVFLIRKPGSEVTLKLTNQNGELAKDIALANGHTGLAELLSDFNSPSSMPLGNWFETEQGVVKTGETGDITLTSKLQNHHRTIEEDIIVLQGIQKQLEQEGSNISLSWQSNWPSSSTDTHSDSKPEAPETNSDETYKTICEKTQELPGIVTIETINNCNHDHDTSDDTADDNDGCHDDIEDREDCDIVMDTEQLPRLHVSESEEEVEGLMEDSIAGLHEYNESLRIRINQKHSVFNRILEQLQVHLHDFGVKKFNHIQLMKKCQNVDIRAETLARFSTSCPSLDVESRNSPLPVIDEADHHKSMVALGDDNDTTPDVTTTPNSIYSTGDLYSSGTDIHDSSGDNICVVVKGTSGSSSTDIGLRSQEYDVFLNNYYGGNVPQVRRRSSSPLQMKGERPDVSLYRQSSPASMLIHANKSSSLLPSEGDETDDDSFRDVSASASDSNLSAGTDDVTKRAARSTGDIEDEHNTDGSQYGDSPDYSSHVGRGHVDPIHKARYSADIEHMMRSTKERHSGSSLDKMSSSVSAKASPQEVVDAGLNLPHTKMTKALSTSSIPAATQSDKHRGHGLKGLSQDAKHAQFLRQEEIEEEELPVELSMPRSVPTTNPALRTRKKADMTFIDFLNENDPSNFSTNNQTGEPSPKVIKDLRKKEEKKRKESVFSRFHSSYRKKSNKEKEGKNKSSHRFVSVSFSNATTCDLCHKPLTNKPAVQCGSCLVNVHENSCKEHITTCEKIKPKGPPPRQSSNEESGFTGTDKPTSVSNIRPSQSFKNKAGRTQSSYIEPVSSLPPEVQQLQSTSAQLHRRSLPTPRIFLDKSHLNDRGKSPNRSLKHPPTKHTTSSPETRTKTKTSGRLNPNTGTYLQWRRASAVSVDHPIAEEGEVTPINVARLDLAAQSNITEINSQSIESLDEVDSVQEVRYDDIELGHLDVDEPETWSETADKKTLKKLNPKDVKRQDTIWELIQTERHYCKRLKTLQIFFRDGVVQDLHWPAALVNRLFPHLDDLIQIHMLFLRQLQALQNKRPDRSVEELGPTLKEQFSGESGNQMKVAYGAFCSGHLEAVQLYKDMIAKDRKFQTFIKQRTNHPLCKKREIPDFILLITQRPTKYPTLIEAIIKSTKDKKDRECLLKSLEMSRDVLKSVDEQVDAAENQMKLKDIHLRLDSRSWALHRGKKFKKSDVLANNRRLLHEGVIGWKNARGKTVDVLAVLMNDVLFFLQENNQKYSFFSHDNKYGVVSLFNLLVREKRDAREVKGIYLISQNKQSPEMYEVVFNSSSHMQSWAKKLRAAVELCPEEEDEVPTEADEERKKMEERSARAKEIMDELHRKDEEIRLCCLAKNDLMMKLVAVYNETDEHQQSTSRPVSRDFDSEMPSPGENTSTLQAAIQEVSNAASQLTTMLQGSGTPLSRSVSSVGEHVSRTFTAIPVPKRAETFAGFDNSHDLARETAMKTSTDEADFCESPQSSMYKDHDTSDLDLTGIGRDIPSNSIHRGFDDGADSGRGSSPGAFSSASALSPMSAISASQEQTNVAHLLRTLNSIVHLTASQGTAVETLRAQLAEANERINKLSADVHEKKSGYKHNTLEELRNLQGSIEKERQEWEVKKAREQLNMEQDKEHLDKLKTALQAKEADHQQQKDDLNKKREKLQLQLDMLREKGQITLDPALRPEDAPDKLTCDNVQSKLDFIPGHRRSASAESINKDDKKSKPGGANNNVPKESSRLEQSNSRVSKLNSFSFGNKQHVPDHLISATNEQKIGSKNVQKLPSKLLSGSGGHSVSTSALPMTSQSGMKGQGHDVGNKSGHASSPALRQDLGSQSGSMGHSTSAGHIGDTQGQGHSSLGTSVSTPQGNWKSNRPKPQSAKGGLSGLLKLAEKSDKKGKGSSSQSGARASPPQGDKSDPSNQRPQSEMHKRGDKDTNKKSQKSESDVIYF